MQIRVPFASISLFAFLGAMAGCGDDIPPRDGGIGGSGGRGGGTGGSVAGMGGGGTGGGGTGGSVAGTGGGGTGGTACYAVTFTAPITGATLTVADDTTTTCADGFQYAVAITTNAPAGTMVQLFN